MKKPITTRIKENETHCSKLLQAFESNRFDLFKKLLKEGLKKRTIDLKNENSISCLNKILDVCCTIPGNLEFITELLSVDVDVNYANDKNNRAPIHLAAMNGCKDVLNVLLEYPGININVLDADGNSALHLAVFYKNLECSQLLLDSKDIQPNLTNIEGVTPAYTAATSSEKNDTLVRSFLRCPKVNLDMIIHGESLSEVITKNYPLFIPFRYLYLNDESGFISYINSTTLMDGDDGEYTYLQYACDYGLSKVVRALLNLGTDPNKISKNNSKQPIFIASFRGFNIIIRMFLQSPSGRVNYQSDKRSVLHEVIIGSNNERNVNSRSSNHNRALKLLLSEGLKKNLFDINLADEKGNTCLHYAVKIGNINYIHLLLDSGAYICIRNNLGQSPLDDISYDILKSYLNKCVKTNGQSSNQEDFEIICSYKFLCPPKVFKFSTETTSENQNTIVQNIPETKPFIYISDNPKLRPLLMHPVLTCFLHKKWTKVNNFYMVNVIVYLGFLIFLNSYITSICTYNTEYENRWNYYLRTAVWGFLILLVFRELLQFISSPISFILSTENWLELCLIILTSYFLIENFSTYFRIPLCIILILTSFGVFICILSRHPMMSLQWEMFKVVTKNCFNFLVWYTFIIVAFVLCFWILLKKKGEESQYNNFFFVFFKVIIMLTGELDTDNLPTESLINKIVILLFVFFITLVLVNLLVGLAVSDTQEIKNNAEIIAIVSRIKYIYAIESRVTRDKCKDVYENQSKHFICKIISYYTWYFGLQLIMFPAALKNPEIKMFPNKNNVVEYESFDEIDESSSQISCTSKLRRYHMDDDTIKRAKLIIKSNTEKRDIETMEKITEILYNKCNEIENTIKEIRELSSAINS